ncbi:hypothetical protein T492DRAFT_994002 [Pavlovales sp. CCMP2436]|nr:hypothetical protein T492DRAFT_994002 [Pavlovales sp. CCMP2436]
MRVIMIVILRVMTGLLFNIYFNLYLPYLTPPLPLYDNHQVLKDCFLDFIILLFIIYD